MAVKHTFVSAVPDGGNTSLVRPSNWNADHLVEFASSFSADDSYDGIVIPDLDNLGGVTQWDAVYLNSSSQWVLADANGSGTYPARGLAVSTEVTTDPVDVLIRGTVRNDAWNWTPGNPIYLSETAGGLTQTAPSYAQEVGYAITADIAFFDFNARRGPDPRTGTVVSSATPTPNADAHDGYTITALAEAAELQNPTGTPKNMQALIVRIKDDGTARALTFDTDYRAVGATLPTTTAISKTMYLGMIYNSADSKWDVLSVIEEA